MRVTSSMNVYMASDGWRWRLVSSNGKITAESGEAYIRKRAAVDAANKLSVRATKARLFINGVKQ